VASCCACRDKRSGSCATQLVNIFHPAVKYSNGKPNFVLYLFCTNEVVGISDSGPLYNTLDS
jgi:hypothetical protein